MALDLNKMRAKLNSLSTNGKSDNTSNNWKPEEGQHSIRIVPTPDGDPFKEFWFHYGVGKAKVVLCPKKNHNEECPICDFGSQLWKEGVANNDDESKKMAKSLFARQRFSSAILVRGEEKKGVQVWSYGKTAYETLIQLVLNPDYGDITDPEDGLDLVVDYAKAAGPGAFPTTKITPRRRSSPLCDPSYGGAAKCKEILDTLPDFEKLNKRLTTAEVQKILDEAFASDESAEDRSSTTTRGGSAVDEAFDEFVNNK